MSKNLFRRYVWLVDTIRKAGKITFEEINEKWLHTEMSGGEDLPLKTFHNHRVAVQDIFDINIECDRKNGYRYYIENEDDLGYDGLRSWLLDTLSINCFINESVKLKDRILMENIPSGQKYLKPVIEAMKNSTVIKIRHFSFWTGRYSEMELEPYCVKVFRQRWYVVAKNAIYGNIRIYSLDRITEMEMTDKKYVFPDKFDAEEFFYNNYGIIVDPNVPPETIKLKVYWNKSRYIESLPLHHSQKLIEKTDEYSVFEYFLAPTYDFRQEILSLGNEAEIIYPEHFRVEIRNMLGDMLRIYSKQ